MINFRPTVALLLSIVCQISHASSTQIITLATTSWCPYTCGQHKDDIGIIGTYVKEVLATLDIELRVETYPWSRAIRMAEQGKVDGLLTAIPQEAPNLLFTQVPLSTYQMCFYTHKSNNWQYLAPLNIGENRFAVIQDYGYGEPVDSYVKNRTDLTRVSGIHSSQRLLELLIKNRVDIIIGDPMVLGWSAQINHHNLQTLAQAGCLPKNPFYLALTPNEKHKDLITALDKALKNPTKRALLDAAFSEYALQKK